MEAVFWSAVAIVVYIYAGYPAIIWLLGRFHANPKKRPGPTPSVTVVIAARNEETHIGDTLQNKLLLVYPPELLEIIVVSDQSADQTDSIVRQYAEAHPDRVRLIRQSPRRGKTAALNLAVPLARGEIVVFSDANSIYDINALRALVRNFADSRIGYVTGKMIYVTKSGSSIGDGCSAFMKYENFLRLHESRVSSVVGVDGGIDAIRKSLWVEMRPDQLPDFVLPLQVVKNGYRVIYEPEAILREEALTDARQEYRMRVRVGLRALWALYDMRIMFNPARFGLYAWQLMSHKALRYLAFIPLAIMFCANAILVTRSASGIYGIPFAAQLVVYTLAVFATRLERHSRANAFSAFARYFALINIASAHAFLRFVRGEKQTVWTPRTG